MYGKRIYEYSVHAEVRWLKCGVNMLKTQCPTSNSEKKIGHRKLKDQHWHSKSSEII